MLGRAGAGTFVWSGLIEAVPFRTEVSTFSLPLSLYRSFLLHFLLYFFSSCFSLSYPAAQAISEHDSCRSSLFVMYIYRPKNPIHQNVSMSVLNKYSLGCFHP